MRQTMRLLGMCPGCRNDDTLSVLDDGSVQCHSCIAVWDSWSTLVDEEEEHGRRLIPVQVEWSDHHAMVRWPTREIPCARFVRLVLNSALMELCNLRPCLATEGGVEGIVQGEPIELRNTDDTIGLFDDHRFDDNPQCQRLLMWYGRALELLFCDELRVRGWSVGRGALLKLSEDDPEIRAKAGVLLASVLDRLEGRRFTRAVFRRLERQSSDTFTPYIAGLTDEEIVRRFVQPPIHTE